MKGNESPLRLLRSFLVETLREDSAAARQSTHCPCISSTIQMHGRRTSVALCARSARKLCTERGGLSLGEEHARQTCSPMF